jgi:hypothetical protein
MSDCHIKVTTDSKRHLDSAPALCGGTGTYISFNATDEVQVEATRASVEARKDRRGVPLCPRCCSAFLANYKSDEKVLA